MLKIVFAMLCLGACASGLSPSQVEDVAHTEAVLERCRAEGRAAHSYRAYVACTEDAGLRDITDADAPEVDHDR